MSKTLRTYLVALLLLGIVFTSAFVAFGCGGTSTTSSTPAATSATSTAANNTVIADRALKVMASIQQGANVQYGSNSTTPAKLYALLQDPAQKATVYVLDVRSQSQYAAGHIEGAVQADFTQWASPDNLAKYPKDKMIFVISQDGSNAAQVVTGLRMLGYNAIVMKEGMNGWAANQDQATVQQDLSTASYPDSTVAAGTTSTPAPAGATFDQPSSSDYSIIAEQANSVFSKMPTSGQYANETIKPAQVNTMLQDPAQKAGIYLLDIRAKADYDKGHIEGAQQVDFTAVAVPQNLQLLPKDKKIIVICYTGNTAAQANGALQMLGYDSAVMLYGMMGWDGTGKQAYLTDLQNASYPVVTGAGTSTTG